MAGLQTLSPFGRTAVARLPTSHTRPNAQDKNVHRQQLTQLTRVTAHSPGSFTTAPSTATSATATSAQAATSPLPSGSGTMPAVMTDETVPEGHQGLHGFLYGEGGADVHDAVEDHYQVQTGEDDGSVLIEVSEFETSRQGHKLAGVYAVYDKQETLQYVGYSRNILLSLKGHRTSSSTAPLCHSVRVRVFRDPSLVTRSRLDLERQQWMEELAVALEGQTGVAPGNMEGAVHLWEGKEGPSARAAASVMSEGERAEYEEKKLKMRKAMGENLHDDVEGESMDSRERRKALLQAVEGDDWSSVINLQTSQTKKPSSTLDSTAEALETVTPPPSGSIVSPFAGAERKEVAEVGVPEEEQGDEEWLEMTKVTVDSVLDGVRPYLIADGGNVEVVAVDPVTGAIDLQLQGACGSCPSSTTTMKMGIERHLREKFGDLLGEVRQVGNGAAGALAVTVALVDAHLDVLRPAIKNFNGSVEVLSVDPVAGTCEVKYVGPGPVGMGIQAAIKDKFPMIQTVTLVSA